MKTFLLNLMFGKPKAMGTCYAPGTIVIRSLHNNPQMIAVRPVFDVLKRPRRNTIMISGVYLRLPFTIPVAHIISYREYEPWEYGDKDYQIFPLDDGGEQV